MKKIMTLALVGTLLISATAFAQDDKSKRPSPPVKVAETGVIWRAGANEATVFETSKSVQVEGKPLAAGKYAFFVLCKENGDCELIFNKNTKQWGAYDYKQAEDVIRVTVKSGKSANSVEKLTYSIGKDGHVSLNWGTMEIGFKVQ